MARSGIWGVVAGLIAVLSLTAPARASTITGGVYTNICINTGALGPVSCSSSSGPSFFTVSADAEGTGLTFGDSISATDSYVDTGVPGNSGYAYTTFLDPVTVSTAGTVTLMFSVHGATTIVNGGDAFYQIRAELDNSPGARPVVVDGTGSGTVEISLPQLVAGSYYFWFQSLAFACFYGCEGVAPAGLSISDTADFLDTFQLVGVTDSGGGTIIGADGINFTALSPAAEPSTGLLFVGPLMMLGGVLLRSRRDS